MADGHNPSTSPEWTDEIDDDQLAPSPRFTDFLRAVVTDKIMLPALLVVLVVVAVAVAPGLFAPHDPNQQSLQMRNRPPGTEAITEGEPAHLLGTDALGRDVLSRLVYGARISFSVGLAVVLISGTIGVTLGLVSGYYGGKLGGFIMRIVDLQMSLPSLLLALFILFIFGGSYWNLVLVMSVTRWMVFARVTRSLVLTVREQPYIEAARALGLRDRRIVVRHVLPNLLSPILILSSLEVAAAILGEAGLSFLGLGIQAPAISWGLMLSQGRTYITSAWWLVTMPGLAILVTALSFNLLAPGIRELTDPTNSWRWLTSSSQRAA